MVVPPKLKVTGFATLCFLSGLLFGFLAECPPPAGFPWESVLSVPPQTGSSEQLAELEFVYQVQTRATPIEKGRAASEFKLHRTAFKTAIGDEFEANRYPKTFELLRYANETTKDLVPTQKKKFNRPRPALEDARIIAMDAANTDRVAYPSGHSFQGALWSLILSEVFPEKEIEIVNRGKEIGWDRVIAGMHYPSDVVASRILAQLSFAELKQEPAFLAKLAEAQEERKRVEAEKSASSNSR